MRPLTPARRRALHALSALLSHVPYLRVPRLRSIWGHEFDRVITDREFAHAVYVGACFATGACLTAAAVLIVWPFAPWWVIAVWLAAAVVSGVLAWRAYLAERHANGRAKWIHGNEYVRAIIAPKQRAASGQ